MKKESTPSKTTTTTTTKRPKPNIILNGERQHFYDWKVSKNVPSYHLFKHSVGNPSQCKKKMQEKETKGIKIKKEEIKLSPFTDGMAVFVENSKASNKKPHTASK